MTDIFRVADVITPIAIQPVALRGPSTAMVVPFQRVVSPSVAMIGVTPMPEPTREGFTRADANAATLISDHMKKADGGRAMTWERIKERAGDDKLDADTRKAYQHMVNNPDVYRKIETRDVAKQDNISSRQNFENVGRLFSDAAPAARVNVLASSWAGSWGGWGMGASVASFFQTRLVGWMTRTDSKS